MNHSKKALAIAAIVSALAMTGVVFAIPQQALAHYGHHHLLSNKTSVTTARSALTMAPTQLKYTASLNVKRCILIVNNDGSPLIFWRDTSSMPVSSAGWKQVLYMIKSNE
jgi:hypothetical protein